MVNGESIGVWFDNHDGDGGDDDAVCLLLLVPGRCPLVGSNPSSPRLTTFCFAEKVLLPCLKLPGRCGGRCWSLVEDIQEWSPGRKGKSD